MKYKLIVIIYSVLLYTIWSLPMSFLDTTNYANKDKIENEKAIFIINAVKNEDFEALQSLFQPSVIESSKTLYEDSLELFSNINIDTYEIVDITISESAKFGDGQGIVTWIVVVELKVNSINYILSFTDTRKNYTYEDDIGIKSLKFLDAENYSKYKVNIRDLEPGIFNPARHTISEQ